MAKRINERQRLALKLEHLSDNEVREVLDYISIMEAMRRASLMPGAWEDELVSLLADAPENQRARQAYEWEAARRRADRRAALSYTARV